MIQRLEQPIVDDWHFIPCVSAALVAHVYKWNRRTRVCAYSAYRLSFALQIERFLTLLMFIKDQNDANKITWKTTDSVLKTYAQSCWTCNVVILIALFSLMRFVLNGFCFSWNNSSKMWIDIIFRLFKKSTSRIYQMHIFWNIYTNIRCRETSFT